MKAQAISLGPTERHAPVNPPVSLNLTPGLYARWIGCSILGLGILSIVASTLHGLTEARALQEILQRFMHDFEISLPTLFSVLLIFGNAVFCAIIALIGYLGRRPMTGFWILLSLTMLALCYDEVGEIHERLIDPMRDIVGPNQFLHFAWTLVGAAVVLLFAAAFVPFLLRLPRPIAGLMIGAGVIFITGSLGIETLGGAYDFQYGRTTAYHLIATAEETFEMFGMALFGFAVLCHMSSIGSRLSITFGND